MSLLPAASLAALTFYILHAGLHWADLLNFFLFYFLCLLAISAGYHRYFAHRSYECHPVVRAWLLFFGAGAAQGSVLDWASKHRLHHRHVDHERDPYNIQRGFFWAHMGWLFYKSDEGFDNVRDLASDRMVALQARYFPYLMVVCGLVLPCLVGLAFGRPFGGLLWGGFLRVVVSHQSTFLINSAAHRIGSQPYSEKSSARDNWWLGFFAFGEGNHNFHHAFQSDYRNGAKWYDWDPAKWFVYCLSVVGLTWRLRRVRETHLVKLRMGFEHRKTQDRLRLYPETSRRELQATIEACKRQHDAAMTRFVEAQVRLQGEADPGSADDGGDSDTCRSRARRAERERQTRAHRVAWKRALAAYRRALKIARRTPLPPS